MEQLAGSNIIVVSPGRAAMNKACQSRGYVGLKVSAQAYKQSSELHPVVESWSLRKGPRRMVRSALCVIGLGILAIICLLVILIGHWFLSGELGR
jgi:hypothetical protein